MPERVLITGTTSGIGRALLEHYVERGAIVTCVNRRRVIELEERFASARFECVDVRCRDDILALLATMASRGELPELFILNAGINQVDNDEPFRLDEYREVMDTNLYGVLHFVEGLTCLPPSTVERHVVAVGSLVTLSGNPYALGYTSSKRALADCFDTWSKMYERTDLVFQQLVLGPIATDIYTMDEHLPGWMVGVRDFVAGTATGAAIALSSLAQTRKPRAYYPARAVPLFWGMRCAQKLVPGLFQGQKTIHGRMRRASGSAGSRSKDGP